MTLWLVAAAAVLVAFVNGANDVSKGVATLAGSGVTNYRRAIAWGAIWTGLGGLAGALIAHALLTTFGNGLLASGTQPTFLAALAVLVGAGAWVLIATCARLPVSTTHAIIGSIAGVGAVAYGLAGMNWQAIAGKIVLPLLLTPLASMLAATAVLRSVRFVASRRNIPECICVEIAPAPVLVGIGRASPTSAHFVTSIAPQVNVTMGSVKQCAVHAPQSARITMNHLHWLTSGATSFARGLNDAPKIVALALAAWVLAGGSELLQPEVFALITLAMVAGSVIGGLRVTELLAERVAPMDHREGFFANLVTALLVGTGAVLGLPMSTTHVACGAIIGMGVANGRQAVNRGTVRDMLLAWVVTLPAAALLGIAAYGMARIIA